MSRKNRERAAVHERCHNLYTCIRFLVVLKKNGPVAHPVRVKQTLCWREYRRGHAMCLKDTLFPGADAEEREDDTCLKDYF